MSKIHEICYSSKYIDRRRVDRRRVQMQKSKQRLYSKETAEDSKPVLALLMSMGATPTPDQKLALSQALYKCTLLTLSPFIFPDYIPTDLHFRHLWEALESNSTVTSVYLGAFKVCKDISLVHTLCNTLKTNKKLTCLSVTNCDITPEGATLIADALSENTTLKILDISRNTLDTKSATALIAKTTVKGLNLNFNNLSGHDFFRRSWPNHPLLFEALKKNTSLKDLRLQTFMRNLSQEEIKSFEEALEHNTTLENLDLSYWESPPAFSLVLANVIKNNQTLKKLNLSHTCGQGAPWYVANRKAANAHAKTLAIALESRTSTAQTLLNVEFNQCPDYKKAASIVEKAALKHKDAIELRAHTLGSDIKIHLPLDLAGIMADYLDLNGQYFKAGITEFNHPTYVRPSEAPIFKKVKLFSKAVTALGAVGLTLGLFFGGLPVILPAALFILSGLSAAAWVQYTRHKFKNQIEVSKLEAQMPHTAPHAHSEPVSQPPHPSKEPTLSYTPGTPSISSAQANQVVKPQPTPVGVASPKSQLHPDK